MPDAQPTLRIGVLAIQGDYEAHAAAIEQCGAEAFLVKSPEELVRPDGQSLDGLVMPGGESTTMLKFLERGNFFETLKTFAEQKPVFGTCAGAILLAKDVRNPHQVSLAILDMAVERNAYGRQNDSAILELETTLPGGPLETVFIRAPRIVSTGPDLQILASRDGYPVLVLSGKTMAATFHPELSADRRVHRFFVEQVRKCRTANVTA